MTHSTGNKGFYIVGAAFVEKQVLVAQFNASKDQDHRKDNFTFRNFTNYTNRTHLVSVH